MNTILKTGLVAGYAAILLQTSDGPANMFKELRHSWDTLCLTGSIRTKGFLSRLLKTLPQLTICGWCLCFWLILPIWLLQKKPLLDGLAAVSIAGLVRHMAEVY